MNDIARIDFETRSSVNIRLGLDKYLSCPEFQPLVLSGRLPGEDVLHWHRGYDLKQAPVGEAWLDALFYHVKHGGLIGGWNVIFEWRVWNEICVPKLGWPRLKLEQCVDTMMQAAVHNIPQGLEKCGAAMGLDPDQLKSKRGKYLIQRLCCPHKPTKTRPGIWVEDPELFAELVGYCDQDVVAEESIAKRLRPLTERHQRLWILTHRINMRGVPVDVAECTAIDNVVEAEKARLNRELRKLTGGRVTAATKRNDLLAWVNERTESLIEFEDEDEEADALENLKGKTVQDALARTDLTPEVRRALEIRAAVVQTSTAKFPKMLKVQHGGRLRGMLVPNGAGTGRWASKGGVNVQNFARPTLPKKEIDLAVQVLGRGDHDAALALWGDKTMDAAVSCLRGVLHAPDGYDFIDADYSSIENRMSAWLAEQWDKVELFAKGLDEYRQMATKIYGVPYDAVTGDMRQMAKSAVLGCFGPDTPVLTCAGWKRIADVTAADLVHDGVEFVRHEGLAYRGVKPVIDMAGVLVTPDHEILDGERWTRADSVSLSNATGYASRLLQNSGACRDAIGAPPPAWTTRVSFGYGKNVESTCSHVATPLRTSSTRTTAGAASAFGQNGFLTPSRSSSTLKPWAGGILRAWTSIASTMMAITGRATSAWCHAHSALETAGAMFGWSTTGSAWPRPTFSRGIAPCIEVKAPSQRSSETANAQRKLSPRRPVAEAHTFDILNCGPRHRFVVLTQRGPVIAHNCMFGQGWKGLIEFAKGYGVALTEDRSRAVVKLYRDEYRKVRDLWYECGDASIAAVKNPGVWFAAGSRLQLICHRNFLWMRLPSGRLLAWSRPRVEEREAPWMEKHLVGHDWDTGEAIYEERPAMKEVVTVESIDTKTRIFCRHPLIGSSIFQSGVQGGAADVLFEGVENTEAEGYETVLLAHDENMALVREGFGDPDEFGRLMCLPEEWRADLPLAYEAWRGKRFRK